MKSFTVKDIPDATYERLKEAADANRRSINSEILACLEAGIATQPLDVEIFLASARRIRAKTKGPPLTAAELLHARDRGRR